MKVNVRNDDGSFVEGGRFVLRWNQGVGGYRKDRYYMPTGVLMSHALYRHLRADRDRINDWCPVSEYGQPPTFRGLEVTVNGDTEHDCILL